MKTKTVSIDTDQPEPDLIRKAASVILSGGIIAFPTDTSYGLGVNPFDDDAVLKVYRMKRRESCKPLIILLSTAEQLNNLAGEISPAAKKLIDHFWPGPLTLIFTASEELKSFFVGNTGKIGIRIPDNAIARGLVDACRIPVTATSANISGKPSARTTRQVIEYFGNAVNMVLNGGPSKSSAGSTSDGLPTAPTAISGAVHQQPPKGLLKESTVLDLTTSPPHLIREGKVGVDRIESVIGSVSQPE